MARPPLVRAAQGLLWELSPPLRRWLRRLRGSASVARHRLRRAAGTRVVSAPAPPPTVPLPHPAVVLVDHPDGDGLAPGQTERSVADSNHADGVAFVAHGDGLESLPAVHLEAMVMAAAAEDLGWVAGGWSPAAPGRHGPAGTVFRDPNVPAASHLLLRRPPPAAPGPAGATGRVVPHITSAERCDGLVPVDHPVSVAAGPYRLRPFPPSLVQQPWRPVDETLAGLPSIDGPPTALFLLPFLAVGGAERLLFDLLAGLRDRHRLLVATTDPHLEALGQTVDRARGLTPHVYTLGDWLPRDAIGSALRHLVRRWQVRTLMCWNGSVAFYDEVGTLRRRFPDLRLVNQLFNHRGGWIEHSSPSLVRDLDLHVAVNTPIARALVTERGVPDERVVVIHHAVGPPPPPDPARRASLRAELGVDDDTVVIGSFIRLHPQKRPLDIVRLARRMASDRVRFLMVGGGPLADAVDREIARDPPPNLTRRPLHPDARELYPALDLCLLTSEFEGLPVFLLDGLARGIPAVATAVGDVPLLLSEGGGEVVERPGDLDALAAAVRRLLDPERRRAAGEAGRRTVAGRFGLDRYVAAYEAALFPDDPPTRV